MFGSIKIGFNTPVRLLSLLKKISRSKTSMNELSGCSLPKYNFYGMLSPFYSYAMLNIVSYHSIIIFKSL